MEGKNGKSELLKVVQHYYIYIYIYIYIFFFFFFLIANFAG